MNITEFLEARIAEDEAVAKELPVDAPVHHPGCYYYSYSLDAGWFCDCDDDGTTKRRLQAECAAKRAIIAQASEASSNHWQVVGEFVMSHEDAGYDPGEVILQALAAIYKEHPDYQQEWAL